MSDGLRSILIGTSTLGVVLVVACVLTVRRPLRDEPVARARVLDVFLIGVAFQCAHVVEELITGFAVRWPELLGQSPWSDGFFVAFNLAWIAIWLVSAVALRHGVRAALVPIWFFAVAMVINGVGHPALALLAGGYFPGLVTAPIAGILGVLLCVRLARLTAT